MFGLGAPSDPALPVASCLCCPKVLAKSLPSGYFSDFRRVTPQQASPLVKARASIASSGLRSHTKRVLEGALLAILSSAPLPFVRMKAILREDQSARHLRLGSPLPSQSNGRSMRITAYAGHLPHPPESSSLVPQCNRGAQVSFHRQRPCQQGRRDDTSPVSVRASLGPVGAPLQVLSCGDQ